jgi:hypothetical protein
MPVRTRVFTTVVEEAEVVVRPLQRADLALDELVELVQIGGELGNVRAGRWGRPNRRGSLRGASPPARV